MSITPSQPIPRTSVTRWETDFSARIGARMVVLIYTGYDATGNKIAERRFDLTDDSTPSFAQFVAACPAGPAFKRQVEQFGATLHSDLGGTVD